MAGSVNKVILIGNLGADPEIRRTQDGRPVANLRLATSESWRDKATGERKEKTEWHRVVIFNENLCKIAEQYLKKGSKVFIEGQSADPQMAGPVRPGSLLDRSRAAGLPWRAHAARSRGRWRLAAVISAPTMRAANSARPDRRAKSPPRRAHEAPAAIWMMRSRSDLSLSLSGRGH